MSEAVGGVNCLSCAVSAERAEVIRRTPRIANSYERFLCQDGKVVGLFLLPNTTYELRLLPSNKIFRVTTKQWDREYVFPVPVIACFVYPGSHPVWVQDSLIVESPEEYFYSDSFDPIFWSFLFKQGLFALPHGDVVLIPNPTRKFVFDLRRPLAWNVGRRMRRSADEFQFNVVSRESLGASYELKLTELIRLCGDWHTRNGKTHSTWIDERFLQAISAISENGSEIDFHAFTLTETKTNRIAAVSIGYMYAHAFMDFTACTLLRDQRSAGKQLLVHQSDFLVSRGVALWYLGFKLPYMDSLSSAGAELSRSDFQSLWRSATILPFSV